MDVRSSELEGTFNGWVPVSGIIYLEWDVDFVWGGCAGEEPWVVDYGAPAKGAGSGVGQGLEGRGGG